MKLGPHIRPSQETRRPFELLQRLSQEVGRDDEMIENTAPSGVDVGELGEKVREFIGRLEWLAAMGIQTANGWVVGVVRMAPWRSWVAR